MRPPNRHVMAMFWGTKIRAPTGRMYAYRRTFSRSDTARPRVSHTLSDHFSRATFVLGDGPWRAYANYRLGSASSGRGSNGSESHD